MMPSQGWQRLRAWPRVMFRSAANAFRDGKSIVIHWRRKPRSIAPSLAASWPIFVGFVAFCLAGFFLGPYVRDGLVSLILPPKITSVFLGLGERKIPHPWAEGAAIAFTILFWMVGCLLFIGHWLKRIATFLDEKNPPGNVAFAHTAVVSPSPSPDALGLAATVAPNPPSSPASAQNVPGATARVQPSTASELGRLSAATTLAQVPENGRRSVAGRYQLAEELGRGAMGVVYRATDLTLQRELALKTLPATLKTEAQLTDRFLREARVLAKLDHPGIVRVYDLVDDASGLWMAMEYVPGGSLDQLLNKCGKLPLEEAIRFTRNLAAAMAYAHGMGVIHRDFKPQNVLVTPQTTLKIADFGLAKLTESSSALTQVGTVFGSPSYMSPEQASGKPADAKADVYALGMTLYQFLAGAPPFSGNVAEVLQKQIEAPPPAPSAIGIDVPPALEQLMVAMVAKSPTERPTSADVEARVGEL